MQAVRLRTSQLRKYRDEARAKAIRAAKEKAVALAGELGVKIGRPHSISEGYQYSGGGQNRSNFQMSARARGDDQEAGSAFAPRSPMA